MVYQRKRDYEYREGWRPGVDANTVGGVMEEIEERHGTVTSELFLEASRAEDSPTHGVFEWDDGLAAEKYRLHQASQTICAIRVVVQEGPAAEVGGNPPRAYVNVQSDDRKRAQYMNVSDALSNEDTRSAVLTRALRELKAFQEKYSCLSELAEVLAAIGKVHDTIEKNVCGETDDNIE